MKRLKKKPLYIWKRHRYLLDKFKEKLAKVKSQTKKELERVMVSKLSNEFLPEEEGKHVEAEKKFKEIVRLLRKLNHEDV